VDGYRVLEGPIGSEENVARDSYKYDGCDQSREALDLVVAELEPPARLSTDYAEPGPDEEAYYRVGDGVYTVGEERDATTK